ncbi:hypothetical protein BV25DRAFT_1913017 [Artomyces pyxidatus]|uniref:Uncharacterized protein n=1 Tax=Artomyces pyxidatus TaxID=48021 RepID=A0ACB8TD83_9AGAM|nr:hypothetical protein BV25DRAFT_1913017 [Artomyces pyxidatus]
MSGPELILTVIVYGSTAGDPLSDDRYGDDQRRVELSLRPRLPTPGMRPPQIQEWVKAMLKRMSKDMKHTQLWHCEFCDKPARESLYNTMFWTHLTPPRANVYFHNVCNAVEGQCARNLRMMDREMAQNTGHPSTLDTRVYLPGGPYPLAASCVKCNKETDIKTLKKCGGCQLTRYCGTECQRSDWKRHKEFCKMLTEVKWTWENPRVES